MSIKSMPSVSDVMTRRTVSLDAEDSLANALDLMRDTAIRHLPVTRDGRPVGIVTENRLAFSEHLSREMGWNRSLTLKDVMDVDIFCLDPGTRLDHALIEMRKRRADYVLITEGGRFIGIITTTDICSKFLEVLGVIYPSA